jgi:hypothetical protein
MGASTACVVAEEGKRRKRMGAGRPVRWPKMEGEWEFGPCTAPRGGKAGGPAGDRGSGRPAPTQERRVWAAHSVASKQGRGSNGVQIQFNLN